MKKVLSLLLALTMVMSLGVTAFATTEPVDSVGSATSDIDKTLPEEMTGQDTNQSVASQYGEFGAAGDEEVEVYVTKASTYTVTIPKVVILSGATNTATGEYTVKVAGDISGTEYIKVVPEATFTLEQAGKADITATVEQDKVKWAYANLSVDGTGEITATGLSAGSWHGSFLFNISRGEDQTTLEGDGQTYHKMAPSTLSFRSNAPIDEFQQVLINGEPLDDGAYTLTEGSTIVTLNIDYLETLDVDTYEITVVSDNGSPSADFGVVESKTNSIGLYYNQPYSGDTTAILEVTSSFIFKNDGTLLFIVEDWGYQSFDGTYTIVDNTIIVEVPAIQEEFGIDTLKFIVNSEYQIINVETDIAFDIEMDELLSDEDYVYAYHDEWNGYIVAALINENKTSYPEIKSNINNIPVVGTGNALFAYAPIVVAPKLPDSMIYMGEDVFSNETLESIVLPKNLTMLSHAMFRCSALKTITIPRTVKIIKDDVFQYCSDLNEIIFEGTVAEWNNIDGANNTVNGENNGCPWNYGIPATYVQCTDGIVTLN